MNAHAYEFTAAEQGEVWLELTDTERFGELLFCRCTEARAEIYREEEWWICATCGAARSASGFRTVRRSWEAITYN
jgi:hypothetical protein